MTPETQAPPLTHYWAWRKRLPERFRQPCRVIARARMNSILIEFADGVRVVTSRYAVRRSTDAVEEIPRG